MTQQLSLVEDEKPLAPASAQIIEVISRAASDPNVDIDKMERLMRMQADMQAREAKADYDRAMATMQPNMPSIQRWKSGHNLKYAPWETIDATIKPVLAEHGFALTFRITKDAEFVVVTAVLSHQGGHREETSLPLPLETSGSKNNVQSYGSTISYGKRYAGCAILNIVTHEEDDNGGAPVEDAEGWLKKIADCPLEAKAVEALRKDLIANGPKEPRYQKACQSAFAQKAMELKS